ncbi:MAG: hypothetical protein ABIH35_01075 [Patescibacteria group bacterium]
MGKVENATNNIKTAIGFFIKHADLIRGDPNAGHVKEAVRDQIDKLGLTDDLEAIKEVEERTGLPIGRIITD